MNSDIDTMELSKAQYRQAKEVFKEGILRRHEQWQKGLAELLSRTFDDEIGNAYDRSMAITKAACDWYKEADRMEHWYDKTYIRIAIGWLHDEGFITQSEFESVFGASPKDIND